MAFTNDYIMRQIQMLTDGLSELLFQKRAHPIDTLDEEGNFTVDGLLYQRLRKLLLEGKVNEAEDALFVALEEGGTPNMENVVHAFYTDLAQMTDERLVEVNFSRAEVLEGLRDALRLLGVHTYQQNADDGTERNC